MLAQDTCKVYERYIQGSYMVHIRSALCHSLVKIILSFMVMKN